MMWARWRRGEASKAFSVPPLDETSTVGPWTRAASCNTVRQLD